MAVAIAAREPPSMVYVSTGIWCCPHSTVLRTPGDSPEAPDMRFSPREFATDLYSDGFKALSIIAPLISIGASTVKALGIGLQDVSYAWAFVPLLVWTLVAYSRRHAHSKLLERQISGARVELARLRAKGVELRDDALHGFLDPAAYEAWHELAVSWNADVIAAIRKINVADADWFAILDVVPPPRLPMGLFHDDAENKVFAMHDYRLQRLNELIVRMAGTTAG